MKRKTYGEGGPRILKTSISLPLVLLQFAEARCRLEGHNTFSAYVAHLIRMDKDRAETRAAFDTSPLPTPPPAGVPCRRRGPSKKENRIIDLQQFLPFP